jgi:Na+-transporting NADH:ubiquinone oxidoreductase subunit NqrC
VSVHASRSPNGKKQWRDLPAWHEDGVLGIGVRPHAGGSSGDDAFYQVDGISSATKTNQCVDGMSAENIHYDDFGS